MTKATERYGCDLRIYDNGGKTMDRFTLIAPRTAHATEREPDGLWFAVGSGVDPRGVSMCVAVQPGSHLGKRIKWRELPEAVQKLARDFFPRYCPTVEKGA